MQHGLDLKHLPLTDDAEAQRWCSHDETLVRAALLHTIGREEFIKMAQWFSGKGDHYHASTMFYTMATDALVFDQSEKKVLLLQSNELLAKAKEGPGWRDTKGKLNFEYYINSKLSLLLEIGSHAQQECMDRNVEISKHELFAADPGEYGSYGTDMPRSIHC